MLSIDRECENPVILVDDFAGCCVMIREALRVQVPNHDWIVPDACHGNVIFTTRIVKSRKFTWIMNWSDEPVNIVFRQFSKHPYVEEWKPESGQITRLSYSDMSDFALGPVNSGLLRNLRIE